MKGLTSHQANQFLKQYGQNVILEQKKKSIFIKFFEQFNNFLTLLLIGSAGLSFLIGEIVDGILIFSIVFLNGLFGLYQEKKAEESIAALKKLTITKIRVIRDNREIEIDSRYLVPGDVIYIEEGIKIPADAQVIETISLEINEAALTGESLSVIKQKNDEVFSGTIVAKGHGYVQIIKTGMATKFGEIAKSLSIVDDTKTPLQKKLEDLTKIIGIAGIIISVIVFVVSLLQGSTYFPAFLLAISLAVAIVPEGLPAVMTITLAIGTKAMANKKAVVRKLSAIEALGSITLIATDKTGTLTTNKMQVKEIYVDNTIKSQITNHKSQANFKFKTQNSKRLKFENSDLFGTWNLEFSALNLLLLNGILCSTASLVFVHDHGGYDVLGDPTEGALLYLAKQIGLDYEEERKNWQIVDEKPFDSVSKMMTVVVKNVGARFPRPNKGAMTVPVHQFSKGAPESILNICDKILIEGKKEKLTPEKKEEIEKQVTKWARKGLRVLAFAYKKAGPVTEFFPVNAPPIKPAMRAAGNPLLCDTRDNNATIQQFNDMIFLGLVAIHDAPRPEVIEAVKKAKIAGIKVVMITGDNEKTAEAVGVSSGLIKEGDEILTGVQLDEYSDKELLKILPKVKVFARTNPFQKHRIVKLYQQLGEVVAVTGDGINDAIALKQADVGIAMGLVGTDVARETADMVITDDNFASIVTAVEEGRGIINNLKNAIKYLLSCNVSEALSLLVGLTLGLPTLFYPIQLLYINLVTDGLPALMLSFSPRSPHLMNISPEKEMVLLKKKDRAYIGAVGLIGAILVIAAYFLFQSLGKTAAFTVLTLIQSFVFIDLWLSHRHIHQNLAHLVSPFFVLGFSIPLILQFIILSHPLTASLFKVLPVNLIVYFEFLAISVLVLVGIRGVKKIVKL